ncbi:MAG TPA: hypothetical protein VIZ28_05425 [Chitinophagaceae bacterium]
MFIYRSLLLITCLLSPECFGQPDASKIVRAFPITKYIVDLTDSTKVVQVQVPGGVSIAEKQVGLLKGVYRDKHSDTITIGAGRCHLIKGDYYYFSIKYKQSGRLPAEGDLLYTIVNNTPVYHGQVIRLAGSFIGLQSVYEKAYYDRYTVFRQWEQADEAAMVDSMVADIHFTGAYFLDNNPGMNVKIKGGRYDGKMVLNTMVVCGTKDITDFLDYMIARPRLYAGREWKISEIFATWLSEGAPVVIKK